MAAAYNGELSRGGVQKGSAALGNKCRAGNARQITMVGNAHPTYSEQHFEAGRLEIKRVILMERFLIIVEKANGNYSAYCPDLPGCVATGKTRDEVLKRMEEAIKLHLEGMREDNIPVPQIKSFAEYISLELSHS